jgi:valyl-tRNA synthetase
MLITEPWPELSEAWIDPEADAEIGWLVEVVTEVRQLRGEMNVPPAAKPALALIGLSATSRERLARHRELIVTLARLAKVEETDAPTAGSALFVVAEATGALAIADFIDLGAERTRLAREISVHGADIDRAAKKLANAAFLARAPEEVVEESRERLAESESAKAKLEAALARLDALA